MLTAALVILAIWLLGVIFDVGSLINFLLLVGLILLVASVIRGRGERHHRA